MLVPSHLWVKEDQKQGFLHAFSPWSSAGCWHHIAISSSPASAPPGEETLFLLLHNSQVICLHASPCWGMILTRDDPGKWIFPTQESNLGLLPCRQILYQLSHQGSPEGEMVFLWWSCPDSGCPDSLHLPPCIQEILSWLLPGPVPLRNTAFLSSSLWEPSWSEGWITGMIRLCWDSVAGRPNLLLLYDTEWMFPFAIAIPVDVSFHVFRSFILPEGHSFFVEALDQMER